MLCRRLRTTPITGPYYLFSLHGIVPDPEPNRQRYTAVSALSLPGMFSNLDLLPEVMKKRGHYPTMSTQY